MKMNYKDLKRELFSTMTLIMMIITVSATDINTNYPEKEQSDLYLATFDVDVTPPIGYELGVVPRVENTWDMGLRAKGIIFTGKGQPILLIAFDWCYIKLECYDLFRRELAEAAGTIPERVAIHTVHQHDAPRLARKEQINDEYTKDVINRLKQSINQSVKNAVKVTHIGLGEAEVCCVASNRRIIGPDGTVRAGRMSSCKDPVLRAEPEGLIDPIVSLTSFWNNKKPLAVLSYYATHPQSYYRTGIPNPDFPGIARFFRQIKVPEALHIHFAGASGNIAAGKYNDGSQKNRGILAERLSEGMKKAWESTELQPILIDAVDWKVEKIALPANENKDDPYKKWYKSGGLLYIQCLSINNTRILHLPGEPFVEYQVAAKKIRPDLFVAMAANGDGGPVYIPTANAFKEGGYEVGASAVTADAEKIILKAIQELLKP